MICLCYVSSSTEQFNDEALVELLKVCHKNNKALDITGLLLYNGKGTFIQTLEGDEQVITSLYEKIKADHRHQRVNRILAKNITERDFPNWKMGFRNLSKIPTHNIEGFSDFINQTNDHTYLSNNENAVNALLLHFKDKSDELIF